MLGMEIYGCCSPKNIEHTKFKRFAPGKRVAMRWFLR